MQESVSWSVRFRRLRRLPFQVSLHPSSAAPPRRPTPPHRGSEAGGGGRLTDVMSVYVDTKERGAQSAPAVPRCLMMRETCALQSSVWERRSLSRRFHSAKRLLSLAPPRCFAATKDEREAATETILSGVYVAAWREVPTTYYCRGPGPHRGARGRGQVEYLAPSCGSKTIQIQLSCTRRPLPSEEANALPLPRDK